MLKYSVVFVCGLVLGAGVMLIAYPFVFKPPVVNESVADFAGFDVKQPVFKAQIREDASGQDPIHWGRGSIAIHRALDGNYLVEFQDDFEVGPGPNFWLYLNSVASIDDEAQFNADDERLKIAKLKSFTGSQVYHIDRETLEESKALTIWCESFGQYIASADFEIPQN